MSWHCGARVVSAANRRARIPATRPRIRITPILSLGNPLVLGFVVPFGVTLAAVTLARLASSGGLRIWLSGAAIALGFLAAHVVIFGWPAWPPLGAQQKIAVAIAGSIAIGLIADLPRAGAPLRRFVAACAIVVATAWLVLPLLRPTPALDTALAAGALGAALVVAWRCGAMLDDAQAAGATLAVAAFGLSVIAVLGNTASIGQLAGALAAAAAAYTIWNWLGGRDTFGTAAALGGFGALALLTAQAVAFTRTNAIAIVVLLGSLFAPRLVRAGLPRLSPNSFFFAIVVAIAAAIPVGAAVAVAILAGGGRGPY